MAELNLPQNILISFPDGKDKLMHFQISIRPDEGIYRCVAGRRPGGHCPLPPRARPPVSLWVRMLRGVWPRVTDWQSLKPAGAGWGTATDARRALPPLPPGLARPGRSCRGGKFVFDFAIPTGYPHDAPKVLCLTKARTGASRGQATALVYLLHPLLRLGLATMHG